MKAIPRFNLFQEVMTKDNKQDIRYAEVIGIVRSKHADTSFFYVLTANDSCFTFIESKECYLVKYNNKNKNHVKLKEKTRSKNLKEKDFNIFLTKCFEKDEILRIVRLSSLIKYGNKLKHKDKIYTAITRNCYGTAWKLLNDCNETVEFNNSTIDEEFDLIKD